MKRVEAIIRTDRLHECVLALDAVGVSGVTTFPARGHGVQGGIHQSWRGSDYVVDLLPKTVVVVVVSDEDVREVVETVEAVARTGKMGDGKVFVTPVERVMRVRTGEVDEAAIRPPERVRAEGRSDS